MIDWNEDNFLEKLTPQLRKKSGGAMGPCPDAETLCAVIEGQASGPERDTVIEHLSQCAACAELRSRLLNFESVSPPEPEAVWKQTRTRLDNWLEGFLRSEAAHSRSPKAARPSRRVPGWESISNLFTPRKIIWAFGVGAVLVLMVVAPLLHEYRRAELPQVQVAVRAPIPPKPPASAAPEQKPPEKSTEKPKIMPQKVGLPKAGNNLPSRAESPIRPNGRVVRVQLAPALSAAPANHNLPSQIEEAAPVPAQEPAALPSAPPDHVLPTETAQATVQGYVTAVEGNNVMLDMGSSQGIHQGSRLALYKASDPNTRVGVIEIIQVIDAGTSKAQIVTLNTGVRPEFSDVVRRAVGRPTGLAMGMPMASLLRGAPVAPAFKSPPAAQQPPPRNGASAPAISHPPTPSTATAAVTYPTPAAQMAVTTRPAYSTSAASSPGQSGVRLANAERVRVECFSDPSAADILIDGEFYGNTPSILKIPVGKHALEIQLSGYKTYSMPLILEPGTGIRTIRASLEQAAKSLRAPPSLPRNAASEATTSHPPRLWLDPAGRLLIVLSSISPRSDGSFQFHGILLLPVAQPGPVPLDRGAEVIGVGTMSQGQTSLAVTELVVQGARYTLKDGAGAMKAQTPGAGGAVQFDRSQVLVMCPASPSVYEKAPDTTVQPESQK